METESSLAGSVGSVGSAGEDAGAELQAAFAEALARNTTESWRVLQHRLDAVREEEPQPQPHEPQPQATAAHAHASAQDENGQPEPAIASELSLPPPLMRSSEHDNVATALSDGAPPEKRQLLRWEASLRLRATALGHYARRARQQLLASSAAEAAKGQGEGAGSRALTQAEREQLSVALARLEAGLPQAGPKPSLALAMRGAAPSSTAVRKSGRGGEGERSKGQSAAEKVWPREREAGRRHKGPALPGLRRATSVAPAAALFDTRDLLASLPRLPPLAARSERSGSVPSVEATSRRSTPGSQGPAPASSAAAAMAVTSHHGTTSQPALHAGVSTGVDAVTYLARLRATGDRLDFVYLNYVWVQPRRRPYDLVVVEKAKLDLRAHVIMSTSGKHKGGLR